MSIAMPTMSFLVLHIEVHLRVVQESMGQCWNVGNGVELRRVFFSPSSILSYKFKGQPSQQLVPFIASYILLDIDRDTHNLQ